MSQGFTKGTPIDTDPTLSLNSDIVVPSQKAVKSYLAANYQPTLVSGTNIKTVNGNSLLGSGDLIVGGGGLTVGTTPITSGVDGRVLFQSGGVVSQDSGFSFNSTSKRLDIGNTVTPSSVAINLLSNNYIRLGTSHGYIRASAISNILFYDASFNIQAGVSWGGTGSFFNTSLAVGTNTAGARLDVRAQGALSTDIAFRVRNSVDTRSNLTVNGLGQTRVLSNSFSGNFFTISYVADNSVERDAFIFTQNIQNAMGQAWTFDAGYNGVQERLTISNNLTGINKGIFSIHASNFCFGTTILNNDNTADRRVLRIATGVAPTTSFTDGFKFYSADIVAGNAAPHFRTENGSIIKLFQGAALTAEDGTLANAVTRIAELETRLKAHGLIA